MAASALLSRSEVASEDLSPRVALRMLRSLVYSEWDLYQDRTSLLDTNNDLGTAWE
jgi:hypothetical protein